MLLLIEGWNRKQRKLPSLRASFNRAFQSWMAWKRRHCEDSTPSPPHFISTTPVRRRQNMASDSVGDRAGAREKRTAVGRVVRRRYHCSIDYFARIHGYKRRGQRPAAAAQNGVDQWMDYPGFVDGREWGQCSMSSGRFFNESSMYHVLNECFCYERTWIRIRSDWIDWNFNNYY